MTSVEEFNCILCKESFDSKDELQIHFRKHGDPKFNESIKTKSRVQNAASEANEKSNDTPEMVNCDVCDEVFPTISKAITHKHKCHPEHDAKYFCPWCGKLFTMKHLYNKHLHTNHDAIEETVEKDETHFHCDSCNVYFFVPAAMVYHNRFFHRQDTELPIMGQSTKQKLFSQDLLPVYYCSFCGEEYINKVNLHKHICDDHRDENQHPTDVLRCPLCEAIFYHLDAYELHLTFHSSADLYSETNDMNKTEITEFSLETIPPTMDRIEDLNNLLPDDEHNADAVGIESFLQMAMDEPHDDHSQVSKKSKKHKKHKKSKKSAITLDEFLNMNQDVFGEDLDFHGVEEVPTKVIKRQLKPKKPPPQKMGAKFAASADLQKLQKQGIVVKMKSRTAPLPPSLQAKTIGQPIKVSPHLKMSNKVTTKAISASNEVLSKLMNQGSNQLKIVKKSASEKVHVDDEQSADETVTEDTINKSDDEAAANADDMDNHDNTEKKINFTLSSKSGIAEDNKPNSRNLNASELHNQDDQCITAKSDETEIEPNVDTNSKEINTDMSKADSHKKLIANISLNPNMIIKDTLKNIGSQITIKPIKQSHDTCSKDKPEKSISPKTDKQNEVKVANDSESELDVEIGSKKSNNTLDSFKNINSEITIKSLKEKSEKSTSPKIEKKEDIKLQNNVENELDKNIEYKKTNKTLDTLKSINSAITIRSLKNKNVTYDNRNNFTDEETENKDNVSIPRDTPEEIENTGEKLEESTTNIQKGASENQIKISSPSHVLKILSKNVTIKSMSTSTKQPLEDGTDKLDDDQYNSEFEENGEMIDEESISNKSVSDTPALHENSSSKQKKYTDANKPTIPRTYNNEQMVKRTDEKILRCEKQLVSDENIKTTNMQVSNDLLKNLKNITAKPVSAVKNIRQQVTAKSTNMSTNITKSNNFIKKSVQKNVIGEEIEIFNIDDSDSDGAVTEQRKSSETDSAANKLEPGKSVNQLDSTLNVIKNISKHITIKSSNNSNKQVRQVDCVKTKKPALSDFDPFSDEDDIHDDAVNDSFDDLEDNSISVSKKVMSSQVTNQKDDVFKSVLKNLGKHITVKSRNASPSPSLKYLDHGSQDSNRNVQSNDDDSDPEFHAGKVKITELTDDNLCDDDNDHTSNFENKGIVTQSPDDSNSANEHFSEMEESDGDDGHIPRKLVKTSCPELKSNNDCLKNISKNITIKTLSERSVEKQGRADSPWTDKEKVVCQNNFNRHLSIKPVKQKSEIQNESGKYKSQNHGHSKIMESPSSSNQSALKHAQSPGIINVNKEVKVKTFQSETVIEEITTTVTKTIRRVNQVNQQVYNANQQPAHRIIQQNNRPRMGNYNQASKNVQGIPVRQPTMSPKIRQAVQYRPGVSPSVRPSNQLVPIRPHANQVRPMNNPRMQAKNTSNQQKPLGIGKPLKISPSVMNQNLKRPGTEETPGPFSCFKKPKESESSSAYHYESSSQVNKFCSTIKTVKDNTVVKSRQMKCESTSQQLQMSRNANVTGLKITNAKQVSQMERSEMSASKRNTLEAIEKLQKQGLLVKKPRVEEDCDSDFEGNNEFNDDD